MVQRLEWVDKSTFTFVKFHIHLDHVNYIKANGQAYRRPLAMELITLIRDTGPQKALNI